MDRTELLSKASETVEGNREQDYGSPEDSFFTISGLWSRYLSSKYHENITVDSKDVAVMMILLKVARIASGHAKDDNWIDICGYAACGGEIESQENDEVQEIRDSPFGD